MGYDLKEPVVFQWPSPQETGSDTGIHSAEALTLRVTLSMSVRVLLLRTSTRSQWRKWGQSCIKPGSKACRRDVVGKQLNTSDEQLLASWIQDVCWTSLSAQNRQPCPPRAVVAAHFHLCTLHYLTPHKTFTGPSQSTLVKCSNYTPKCRCKQEELCTKLSVLTAAATPFPHWSQILFLSRGPHETLLFLSDGHLGHFTFSLWGALSAFCKY